MQMKHILLVGLSLSGIGAMMSALPDWAAALEPTFIGGVIGVVGAQITSLYTERPNA